MVEYNFQQYLDVYTKDVELPGSGKTVTIKPLTTNQMKKLLVHEDDEDSIKGESILDEILQYCITSGENIGDFELQDRYFLFIEVRKFSKGSKHTYEFTCPNEKCQSQSIQSIDLNDLDIKQKPEEVNPEVSILNDKVKLYFKYITRAEQAEAYNQLKIKGKNENQVTVEMMVANMAQSIYCIKSPDSEDNDIPFKVKFDFVGNLPQSEYDKIKEWFDVHDYGIDLNITINCPHCEYSTKDTMPLTNFFQ